ncbi:MAG: stage III sporulation protein AF [Clostridiales bacterium]|jgi:stage III sporulation protein AF|nr:stage III sporulation protein AF [Clostridiales bacterium]
MLAFFREWIANIAAVSVLGVVADLILPDGNIKRYTRFLIGVIMLAVLIKPVLHIFNHMTDLNNLAARNMVLMDLSSLNYKIELYDDKQREEIRNNFKKSLELHMEEQIRNQTGYKDVGVTVHLSGVDNDDKGRTVIEGVYVEIGIGAKGNIQPVRIRIGDDPDLRRPPGNPGEEQKVKELISGIYGINPDSIKVRYKPADETGFHPG